jgi:hypothetical protein
MATKRTVSKKTTRAKARSLPRVARAKADVGTTDVQPKKARPMLSIEPAAPEPDRFRSIVHDAIESLAQARRAHDDMTVHRFRGRDDLAAFEHVVYLESLMRVHAHLVTLDLDLPEGLS